MRVKSLTFGVALSVALVAIQLSAAGPPTNIEGVALGDPVDSLKAKGLGMKKHFADYVPQERCGLGAYELLKADSKQLIFDSFQGKVYFVRAIYD